MAFKGTLKEFKVPDILQLISLQKKTGILTFNSPEGFITILFEDGLVVGIDAFPKKLEMRVGSVLVKQEIISEEMLQRALSIQKRTGQKVGEILVGMGLIDEGTVPEALKTQAVQIVLSLFTWKKGEYNFKVMDRLEPQMRTLDPLPTDNLIMEGVQMLDEWPLMKRLIPSEEIVFEAVSLGMMKVTVVSEYDEETEMRKPDGTVALTETEVNLLKYINGKNRVRDLVEMGLFTEYKIYKNLFNLVNKGMIRTREPSKDEETLERRVLEEVRAEFTARCYRVGTIMWFLFLVLFLFTLTRPFHPWDPGNLIQRTEVTAAVQSSGP